MDWGVANGTATVMGLADGSASIYLSSGGGSIGGQSVELIRKAAQYAVTVAAELQPTMHTVKEFPLPTKDQVVFYVLTDAGVFGEGALSDEFKNQQHRLTKLGSAMQQIITQYRLIQK